MVGKCRRKRVEIEGKIKWNSNFTYSELDNQPELRTGRYTKFFVEYTENTMSQRNEAHEAEIESEMYPQVRNLCLLLNQLISPLFTQLHHCKQTDNGEQ